MNEDKFISEFIELKERVAAIEENMATKSDMNEVKTTLDKLVVLAEKKDGEVDALALNQKRMQNQVDTHEEEIVKIKTQLQAA